MIITPSTLFLATMLLLVVVIMVFGIRSSQSDAQFEVKCRDRGWDVKHPDGTSFPQVISGTISGIPWQYEAYKNRTRLKASYGSASSYAVWMTPAATLPGEIVLVYPRDRSYHGHVNGPIWSVRNWHTPSDMDLDLLALSRGPEDVENFKRLQESKIGSGVLRRSYTVLATSEEAAAYWLGMADSTLSKWATSDSNRAALKGDGFLLWRYGLFILVQWKIDDFNVLDTLTTVGVALANQIAKQKVTTTDEIHRRGS